MKHWELGYYNYHNCHFHCSTYHQCLTFYAQTSFLSNPKTGGLLSWELLVTGSWVDTTSTTTNSAATTTATT